MFLCIFKIKKERWRLLAAATAQLLWPKREIVYVKRFSLKGSFCFCFFFRFVSYCFSYYCCQWHVASSITATVCFALVWFCLRFAWGFVVMKVRQIFVFFLLFLLSLHLHINWSAMHVFNLIEICNFSIFRSHYFFFFHSF